MANDLPQCRDPSRSSSRRGSPCSLSPKRVARLPSRDATVFVAFLDMLGLSLLIGSYVSCLAHLIFELYARLATIGRGEGSSFQFPATRALFADAIGTSAVHLNRVVQELRTRGLLEMERGKIETLDLDELRKLADFDPLYLHLDAAL
ncbi:winged helix-turn-helix domain-containing protein [Bradyrhizobium liaoningense]|nr:winged helix-turn-helix domain-containing protein [Bradyrhizobium liaoningense]MBR1002676.1 winged helix-turn-helix domain-containing protein [Bradyrhizobium liaoningense]MBR1032765.1 winged helix-turn-helix domain-containing protein [Bradyrhizobium liaoningense]MBR1069774.1 winged helix-turn-helix domain-containing protein [Bradyrhizobium liaoningense]